MSRRSLAFGEGGPLWIAAELRLGTPFMDKYFYVYILESLRAPGAFYTGFTEDLQGRLQQHNSRTVPHTSKQTPWRLKTAVAFTDRGRALDFERYLKSGSGRAFAKRRL